MAEESAEVQVESNAQETSTAQETPVAENATPENQDAGATEQASEQPPADENSGEQQEQAEVAVDPALFARAIRAGLTEDDVLSLGSEAGIERAIALVESRQAPQGEKPADAQQEAKPTPSEVKEPEWKLPDMTDVAPPIADALKMVPAYVKAAIEAQLSRQNPQQTQMQEQIKGITAHFAQMAQAQTDEAVDSWVEKQGPEWEKTFGKGSVNDLDMSSVGMKNRQKIHERAMMEARILAESGKPVPSMSKLLDVARQVLFPQQAEKAAQKKLLLRAKSAKGTFLAKPSNKPGTPGADEADKAFLQDIKNALSKS